MKPESEFTLIIAGEAFAGINDPQSGIDALFPMEGEGSIESIVAKYGDDVDVVMQSATYYRLVDGSIQKA